MTLAYGFEGLVCKIRGKDPYLGGGSPMKLTPVR